ncbi:hypothetical protein ACLKA7_015594 [Drosophila subpalustris]
MFCTDSCEHCINGTSSGRVLDLKKSSAQMQQESAQMGQQQQQFHQQRQQQHQQQHQQQQQQQQQPWSNMCYGSMPPWFQNCDSEPQRVGLCFVTEVPEGLSIDCNVPIPNSFYLDEFKSQMISFFTPQKECMSCCMPQPQSSAPAPTSVTDQNSCDDEQLFKSGKQPKLEQTCKISQQSATAENHFYPTSYHASTGMSSQMNVAPSVNVVPDNQLLAYLSSLIAPMQAAAATTASPNHNSQTTPSCCLIKVPSCVPLQQQQPQQFQQQQPQHYQQQQPQQFQQQRQQQFQQQYQQQLPQQQHPPTFPSYSQPLLRFELPCVLTGFRSPQSCPDQSVPQPQPPFALQLLSLPGAISMPCIPQSTLSAATSLSSECPSPKPPTPSTSCKIPSTIPRKPTLVNKKAALRNNMGTQCSYGRHRNINGNYNGNGNGIGNGNNFMTQGWQCPCCSHCCCHPSMNQRL